MLIIMDPTVHTPVDRPALVTTTRSQKPAHLTVFMPMVTETHDNMSHLIDLNYSCPSGMHLPTNTTPPATRWPGRIHPSRSGNRDVVDLDKKYIVSDVSPVYKERHPTPSPQQGIKGILRRTSGAKEDEQIYKNMEEVAAMDAYTLYPWVARGWPVAALGLGHAIWKESKYRQGPV